MKVLLLGDDGRAHAWAWKLFNNPNADLICSPGNGGTAQIVPSADLNPTEIVELVRWSFAEQIDLIIPSSTNPLVAGLADEALGVQIGVVGVPARTASLERSRCAGKDFLLRHNLPTPRGRPFIDLATAEKYLAAGSLPVMIKPDNPNLPSQIFSERYAAMSGLRALFSDYIPEERGAGVVIEEYLGGVSLAQSTISDGSSHLQLLPTRIYNRLEDHPESLHAPGVGACTSTSAYARQLGDYFHQRLLTPLIAAIRADQLPCWGVVGIDTIVTRRGPLITNIRFSFRDQEAQAVLPRLEDDLIPLLQAAIASQVGRLAPLRWRDESSVAMSLVGFGYPRPSSPGFVSGLEELDPGVLAFHHQTHNPLGLRYTPQTKNNPGMLYNLVMGTPNSPGRGLSATGGHVLTIVAMAATLNGARGRALINAEKIAFHGRQFRADIGLNDFR